MRENLRFLGLDVHAETIAVAVAEPDGEVRSLGTIANREDSIRKFIKKLGSPEQLRACYEAGVTGFVLYWQLAQLDVECTVVAPTLVPKKPGDRVKTDRRDALKLARSHRSGDLTAVWVPDEASEALRVMESAWCYRHLPRVGEKLRKRQQGIPAEIIEIAWKAQNRLHKRYTKLAMAGKDQRKVITAVGRELLGFIWAIGVKAEQASRQPLAA